MSEDVGSGSSRGVVHRLGAVLLPGLPRLLEGRLFSGGVGLLLWLSLWTVALGRWNRVAAAPGGALDERVALLTLVGGLVGVAFWSLASAGPSPDRMTGRDEDPGGPGPVARAFRRNRLAMAGAVAVGAIYLVALLTPFLAPSDPTLQGDLVSQSTLPPSSEHLLGTDRYARDVLSRLLYGARVSLSVGFVAVAISVTVGSAVGAVAGYLGGRADAVIMRGVDMVLAFPRLILLIAIVAVLESPSIYVIMAVLGLTLWPSTARIVRGEVLSLREREFVEAARALGYSAPRIVFRHLLPNALGPVIVAGTLGIGNTIVLEAGLSFLGIGVQPPTPSWGTMVAGGRSALLDAWWLSTFPGLAIVFTVLAFNLLGDGLRDALDPRFRGRGDVR